MSLTSRGIGTNPAGYRIIRRYENNGRYVPSDFGGDARLRDRWEILRKYYLALPFPRAAQSLPPPAQNVDLVHEER